MADLAGVRAGQRLAAGDVADQPGAEQPGEHEVGVGRVGELGERAGVLVAELLADGRRRAAAAGGTQERFERMVAFFPCSSGESTLRKAFSSSFSGGVDAICSRPPRAMTSSKSNSFEPK